MTLTTLFFVYYLVRRFLQNIESDTTPECDEEFIPIESAQVTEKELTIAWIQFFIGIRNFRNVYTTFVGDKAM
jgi:hypothetical protein